MKELQYMQPSQKKSKDILHITLNRALLSRKGILDI
jgi:hypothetical protein